jgi:dephospho-CoA kinase
MRLGVTGGIGSGKSTVCSLLAQGGAVVIDADAISRACTAPQGPAIAAIVQAFGPSVLSAPGVLDRDVLRERVFSDAQAKAQLQEILHPLIGAEIARQSALAQAHKAAYIVLDLPLLTESQRWRPMLDRVLVVDCSEETQIARVGQRSGLAPAAVRKIMAAQSSRAYRRQCADFLIFNEMVTIDALKAQLRQMLPDLEI